jgi:beta-mannosidase
VLLGGSWQLASSPAGAIASPAALEGAALDWCDATVPSTVASALRAAKRWTLDSRVDLDADDWWWRCTFSLPAPAEQAHDRAADTPAVLRLGGLASIAEAWLNGSKVLESRNMFVEHDVRVEGLLRDRNELVLCFRSVGAALKAKRPRPRWRTRLVEPQQLRWIRTALVGRIPGWTPAAAPVGPWRPVLLEQRAVVAAIAADVRTEVEGADGLVHVVVRVQAAGGRPVEAGRLNAGGASGALSCEPGDAPGHATIRGTLRIENVERWWPHTHGGQRRYPLSMTISCAGKSVDVDLGPVSFRTVRVDTRDGEFAVSVNDVAVFCRGACWTTVDAVALSGPVEAYLDTLRAVRDAGMNMIRICGPFFYEDDALYDACDELGILVWQDFAFANMDYPDGDPGFVQEVEREARQFLDRTQTSACLAVLCGNSEVEQQAAMMGAPREIWRAPLFATTLANASAGLRPDVHYWPSTPSGGGLPFVNTAGTAHYFGVGAYLRPLEDARRAGVRFATECLAFANVPDESLVDEWMAGAGAPPHDPRWKARTPRDTGAGWDFDDVRDFYLRLLFGVDPVELRYSDVSRYLSMSRVATGEVMASTFAEWRRQGSGCRGALVWFLRDLWPGAGWGVLDAKGAPKAAYYCLRRALQPVGVLFVDEGLNGLDAHVVNEGAERLEAELRVAVYGGEAAVATASTPVDVPPRSVARVPVAEMLGSFVDMTYAYRFGPLAHDVTVGTLLDRGSGAIRGEAFHFPRGLPANQHDDARLEAIVTQASDQEWKVVLRAARLATSVELRVRGFEPSDNYFHLAPGAAKEVWLRAGPGGGVPQGTARALNGLRSVRLSVQK